MALALEVIAPQSSQRPACDCPPSFCAFSVPRVRWYLYVWRQAVLAREPFADVLCSESRNSREIDPWTRGGRVDPDRGREIGLSLELARDQGGLTLQPWNAEKIARFLCPLGETDR